MSNKAEQAFIVIGGGIGGLAAALGIAETKQRVKVLEQAEQFGEVGAGIQLAANATNILQRFGVMEKINEIAVFPKRLVLMDAFSGEELSALDLGDVYRERYGAPYIVLHRSDLHRILFEVDRNPIQNWTKGHVTLLGDAAHPMLQYLAQGACQSLEDASYLSDMLQKYGSNIEQAFLDYQEERIPRTADVQTSARMWGEIINNMTPEGILLRDTILKNRTDKDFQFVDRFHGYNIIGIKA